MYSVKHMINNYFAEYVLFTYMISIGHLQGHGIIMA